MEIGLYTLLHNKILKNIVNMAFAILVVLLFNFVSARADYVIFSDAGLGTDVGAPARYGSPDNGSQSTLSEPAGGCPVDSDKCWKYVYTNIPGGWSGWYNLFSPNNKDMSSYENLKLYVKGASGGERFEVFIEDSGVTNKKPIITASTSWEEIIIPLSSFGVNLRDIRVPFNIAFSAGVTGQNVTVFIDYIRFTSPNTPPNAPSSLGPIQYVNGSWGIDTTPTLEFSQSDPNSDQVSYRIQIANGADFSTNLIVDYTSALLSPGTASFTVGQAAGGGSYAVGSAGQTLADGGYWWRVMSSDSYGASSSWTVANGGAMAFGISTAGPAMSGPPRDEGTFTNSSSIKFSWDAGGDPAYDVVNYWLQVGSTPGSWDKFDSEVGNTLTYTVDDCSEGTTYYARVKAQNDQGIWGDFSGSSDGILIDTSIYISYNIYTDNGLPYGVLDVSVFPDPAIGGPELIEMGKDEPSLPDTPEGTKCFKLVVGSIGWGGWQIILPQAEDMSYYTSGYIRLWIKSEEDLVVKIKDDNGIESNEKRISDYGYVLQSPPYWQQIQIPLSAFTMDGVDLTKMKIVFLISTYGAPGQGTTYYIDNVRWVKHEPLVPRHVEVKGYQLLVDGEPFTVKGVNYSPTPVGVYGGDYDWASSSYTYNRDFAIMKSMGVNTIRLFYPPSLIDGGESLNLAHQYGLYFIVTYPIAQDLSTPEKRETVKGQFVNMVSQLKNWPSILMWCLGNEVNSHLGDVGIDFATWWSFVNDCAIASHNEDPHHPVTVACADVPGPIENNIPSDTTVVPNLDIWSFQLYRGNSFGSLFTDYKTHSSKPLLLTEFGCDAWNGTQDKEDEDLQAAYINAQWNAIASNLSATPSGEADCLGGCVFEWSDEWWKHSGGLNSVHDTAKDWTNYAYSDPNMNEEWWGIIAISSTSITERIPRKAFYTLKDNWRTEPLFTIAIKNVFYDNASDHIEWSVELPHGWRYASQYIQLSHNSGLKIWGIQIYTDNKADDAGPKYTGYGDPAGLVNENNTDERLLMCWKITDEKWTQSSPEPLGPGPTDPIQVPDPVNEGAYYFFNNYLWMKDQNTPDDPKTPTIDEIFEDGYYYNTVWNQDGIQYGGGILERGGATSPTYIYLGADFSTATTPNTYSTMIILEFFIP